MLQARDVICAVPTGGGKSLLFQLAAFATSAPAATFVFSPLVSLIADQTRRLEELKLPCISLSANTLAERRDELLRCQSSMLIYLTPEFFATSADCRALIAQLVSEHRVARFVVDEAHTTPQWGTDWRPQCLELAKLRQLAPSVPIACFSATITTAVQEDLCSLLALRNPVVVRRSANRPNIRFLVRSKSSRPKEQLLDILTKEFPGEPFLVYVHGKQTAMDVQHFLEDNCVPCEYYHADMSDIAKQDVLEAFMNGETRGVVATVAFGTRLL